MVYSQISVVNIPLFQLDSVTKNVSEFSWKKSFHKMWLSIRLIFSKKKITVIFFRYSTIFTWRKRTTKHTLALVAFLQWRSSSSRWVKVNGEVTFSINN